MQQQLRFITKFVLRFLAGIFLLFLQPIASKAQNGVYFIPSDNQIDSVRKALSHTGNDSLKMSAYYYLSALCHLRLDNYPKSLTFINDGLAIANDDASEKDNWRVNMLSGDGSPYRVFKNERVNFQECKPIISNSGKFI